MNVLVTGGLGFIGSHLVDLLIDGEHNVTIIDDKSNNAIETDDRCNMIFGSIDKIDPTIFVGFDIIFHLASIVGPAGVLAHGDIGRSIIKNTARLIDYCAINQSLFIDVSTSEVYSHSGILKEDADKICSGEYQFRTEYGVAKLLAEIMIVNRAKITSALKYHIIRPFNVAGPRQQPEGGFVLPRFIIGKLTDQPITVFGDGSQIRSFTDVRDICDAIIKIAFSKYKNEIWNIGNPANEMSIKELAVKIVESEDKLFYIDPQKLHGPLFAEAENKVANIEKLTNLLDWRPKVPIDHTIEDTINYYKKKIEEGYSFDVCNGKKLTELI